MSTHIPFFNLDVTKNASLLPKFSLRLVLAFKTNFLTLEGSTDGLQLGKGCNHISSVTIHRVRVKNSYNLVFQNRIKYG